jgi:hypothetical protein
MLRRVALVRFDVPTTLNSTMATFADDTVMAVRELAISCKQSRYLKKRWRIKLNESKSVHIDFTNKTIRQHSIFISGT